MSKRIIRFCYRKIIDASSKGVWDQQVFESTYAEFLMQVQFYNKEKKYNRFSSLLANTPAAEKLHFLVSAAVTGHLQQLDGKTPDIVNNLGQEFLQFTHYRFEIVESDSINKSVHKIAIHFYSDWLEWHETIGNHLLVAPVAEAIEKEIRAEVIPMQPFLSIYLLKTVA